MLLQAVSLGLAMTGQLMAADLNIQEQRAWQRVAPSIVFILQDGQSAGTAALIDSQGLFLASKTIIHSSAVDGRTADGRLVRLLVKSTDDLTQFVLLEAQDWDPKSAFPIKLAEADRQGRPAPLLAVIGTGPTRADMSWTGRFGIVSPSRRVMPLTEVRFAASPELVGGALVFDLEGRLVGALNATIPTDAGGPADANVTMKLQQRGPPVRVDDGLRAVGPAPLTTAYSVGPDIMRRVVEGFLSPSHEVIHPSIGIFCVDAFDGGALVQGFKEGSTALKGGLKSGDIIKGLGSTMIRNQIDFSKGMLNMKVDQKITLLVKRGNTLIPIDIIVGK